MNLVTHYQKLCRDGFIQSDPRQLAALASFQAVYQDLIHAHHQSTSLLRRIRKRKLVKGLYVYGGVGSGKTYLMDLFYQDLPFPQKLRMHFHAFMQFIHHELKTQQGKKDPLITIAKALSKKYKVICFDEFIVTDIVDAMLLKNLLDALFAHGVCFVATSNTAPDDLYKNGLQRASFLPAITLLKANAAIVHLSAQQDYRLLQIRKSGVYFSPDDELAHEKMEKIFTLLQHDAAISVDPLSMHGRTINIIKRSQDIVWFHFNDICNIPRSQHDYLEICKTFKIVMISHIPVLRPEARNILSLFVKMIDVFYDAGMPLICTAADSAEQIGRHLESVPEYARTQSRLIEMQSEKYFSHHLFIS